jgi:hypothetical protein
MIAHFMKQTNNGPADISSMCEREDKTDLTTRHVVTSTETIIHTIEQEKKKFQEGRIFLKCMTTRMSSPP